MGATVVAGAVGVGTVVVAGAAVVGATVVVGPAVVAGAAVFVGDIVVAMAVGSGELEDRCLVRLQAQPGKAVEDHLHRSVRGPLPVGVLDPQQILSTHPSGVEPVEQGGAGRPDVH
jgi:hypothetical protein